MMESIVIGILFIGALIYLAVLLKKNFGVNDSGCAKGCGTCSQTAVKSAKKDTAQVSAGV